MMERSFVIRNLMVKINDCQKKISDIRNLIRNPEISEESIIEKRKTLLDLDSKLREYQFRIRQYQPMSRLR